MSEEQESSVLFSLNELMSIEEDRIRTEEDERLRAAEDAERARQDAERRAREEEMARMASEEQRRRENEQRSREEAVRLDAIQRGELEKARSEAEQRARMEAMNAQQEHERQLATLKHDKGKKQLRNMLIAGGLAVVLGGSTAGYFVYKNYQENQARMAADAAQRQRLEEEKDRLRREKDESERKMAQLMDDLKGAKSEADRARIQAEIEAERAKNAKVGGGGVLPKSGGDAPKKACKPGDPLCSDI
jgi:colicin import membrane protein